MAELYDVASMTAQRALRELQSMGLTYGVVGKGTFVHPEAPERINALDGQPAASPAGPMVSPQLARFLLTRETFTAKSIEWMDSILLGDKARTAQLHAEMGLLHAILEGQRKDVDPNELDRYQADLTTMAGPPADIAAKPPADDKPKTNRRPKK